MTDRQRHAALVPMRSTPALLAAIFALLSAVSAPAQPRPRIVNGTNTSAFPEVGALLIHESPSNPAVASLCTGTLVGCRSFLTAAHCVCPFTSDDAEECRRQGLIDPRQLSVLLQHAGRIDVTAIALHPGYEFTVGGDLALLTLAESIPAIEPARINDIRRPPLGSDATIVGFGNSGGADFEQNDFGIKRFGSVRTGLCPVDIAAAAHVCWEFLDVGSNTCGGDSGGPLFVDLGDGPLLAGVTSGGENPTCLAPDEGFDTDVHVHRDWIYEALTTSEGGQPCPPGPMLGSPGVITAAFDGRLERTDSIRTLPLIVAEDTTMLLAVLNGALFSSSTSSTRNEFSLSLQRVGTTAPACIDASPGPFDTCRVEDPSPGAWELRIGRLRGSGEFQVTTTTFVSPPDACVGDCDGDGFVSSAELAATVAAVFDGSRLEECPTLDGDGDATVTASEITRAVRNLAGGCGS